MFGFLNFGRRFVAWYRGRGVAGGSLRWVAASREFRDGGSETHAVYRVDAGASTGDHCP
ncbi:MAG: hypothetical protein ABMB14_00500 [Myxococcota bacterium]